MTAVEVERWGGDLPDLSTLDADELYELGEAVAGRGREVVGAVLYELRRRLPDVRFGQRLAALARVQGVTEGTLRRWMVDFQERAGLPAPTAAAEAQQRSAASKDARLHLSRPSASDEGDRRPTTPVESSVRLRAEVVAQPTLPGADEWGYREFAAAADAALDDADLKRLIATLAAVARRRQRSARTPVDCPHPRERRQVKPWGTVCGACGRRIR